MKYFNKYIVSVLVKLALTTIHRINIYFRLSFSIALLQTNVVYFDIEMMLLERLRKIFKN